ncbi:hypothetical protein CL628_01375 [bacterium]|nr:hypothetical protein [bacterium]|tara:strand:- start:1516 stop:1734 length:219 start_codon:yes stop_codon:yes gene_type:complete
MQLVDIVTSSWFLLLLFVWSIPWKGYALWRAARRGHTAWFIALLVLNTAAILDIIYIFLVDKRTLMKEVSDA